MLDQTTGDSETMPHSYPRWTTLDFLAFCDPRIRSFYEYWDGKRGGRNLPSRSDLDPAEMSAFLPSVMLVDVVEQNSLQLRYRLVGTMEAQARGGDPTGRLVQETFIGRSADDVLENYRLVIANAGPVYDSDEMTMNDEFLADTGSLLLPLSDDGRTVNKVIVFAALGRSPVGATMLRRNELSRYPGRGRFGT